MSPRAKPLGRGRSVPPSLSALRRIYEPAEWSLLEQVRSSTATTETLRTADAIAVRLWGGEWNVHGFEAKASRSDWLSERRRPEKSGPLKLFCSAWFLVVAAPWTNILLALTELPDGWGLIETGTGGASLIAKANERRAEEPSPGFMRALLRAAQRAAGDVGGHQLAAPRVVITRPHLSGRTVGLACGHVAPRPGDKVMPPTTFCFACLEGRRPDRAVVEEMIAEATEEDLAIYLQQIACRRRAA
jgi:hypothetical protein